MPHITRRGIATIARILCNAINKGKPAFRYKRITCEKRLSMAQQSLH